MHSAWSVDEVSPAPVGTGARDRVGRRGGLHLVRVVAPADVHENRRQASEARGADGDDGIVSLDLPGAQRDRRARGRCVDAAAREDPPTTRRALALWPRLDRRALTRCHGDAARIARFVARRTSLSPDTIAGMLQGR